MTSSNLHHQVVFKHEDLPWIVFVHGAGGSIKTWKYQVPAFHDFNLLLVDLRDHGNSKNIEPAVETYTFSLIAADVMKVLDFHKITNAFFVSLSLGSLVLQNIALQYPERVRATIMAGGVFKITQLIRLFVNSALILTRFIPYTYMYAIFSYLVMPFKNHQRARKVFVKQSRRLNQHEYDRWITLYQEFHPLTRDFFYHQSDHPQLVVMGSEDYIFLKAARNYTKQKKDSILHVLPGCGHICNIDAPDHFNSIARNFILERL